jgi:hypothetical protein
MLEHVTLPSILYVMMAMEEGLLPDAEESIHFVENNGGTGIYRTHFKVPNAATNRRSVLFVERDGVVGATQIASERE